jgi:hypothetical protein
MSDFELEFKILYYRQPKAAAEAVSPDQAGRPH